MARQVLILVAMLLGIWSWNSRLSGDDQELSNKASVSSTPGFPSRSQGGSSFTATQSSSSQTPEQPRRTRVVFIISDGCEECERILTRLRRPGGDFETMAAAGWKIGSGPENHIQIVNRTEATELVGKLGVTSFPTVACVTDGEIVRAFTDGCTTPLDAWTLGWLMKGKNERPTPVKPEPIKVPTTGNYPLRGNHWSVDGVWSPSKESLVTHLRGAVHANQLAAHWQIETWEYEELRSLHDDLHEREMGGVVPATQAARQNYAPAPNSNFSDLRKLYGKF